MGKRKELAIKERGDESVTLAWGPFQLNVYAKGQVFYVMYLKAASPRSGLRYTGRRYGRELTPKNISDMFYNEYLPNKNKDIIKFIFRSDVVGVLSIMYEKRW